MSRSKKDMDAEQDVQGSSEQKTKRVPKVKSDAEKKEQKDKLVDQIKKYEEKIVFHQEKLETLTAKKRLSEGKLKKM